jgi:hypothetical protein
LYVATKEQPDNGSNSNSNSVRTSTMNPPLPGVCYPVQALSGTAGKARED